MNATPNSRRHRQVDDAAVQPLPNCGKVYVKAAGPISACRCANQPSGHAGIFSGAEKNPPVYVYDTSGRVHRIRPRTSTSATALRPCALNG